LAHLKPLEEGLFEPEYLAPGTLTTFFFLSGNEWTEETGADLLSLVN